MSKIAAFLWNDSVESKARLQFGYALCFPAFTILALGIDSVWFTQTYFDARQITNTLIVLYFLGFFMSSSGALRKLMLVMLPLSYLGELIFCSLLEMYAYRTPMIPLYVPFGHAIVYASGYVFAFTVWSVEKELHLRRYFLSFFTLLFLGVGLFLNDYLSLIFGILFFLILKRKRWQNLYSFIAFCVIFIELVGTYFKCWAWDPHVFGVIPTSNPPMGAVFIYAGGDVLLTKIVSLWDNRKKKNK